jgi:hypothetical protein
MEHHRHPTAMALTSVFVAAAAATVLTVRAGLALTGYPHLGGNGFHIAHVLWGGLLLALALLALLGLSGPVVRSAGAVVGGAGFGLFLDEIGKFITADYDYFFHRAAVLVYLTLAAIVVCARLAYRRRPLSEREHLAAAAELAVAGLGAGLTSDERERAWQHLTRAGTRPGTAQIADLLSQAHFRPPGLVERTRHRVGRVRIGSGVSTAVVFVGMTVTLFVTFGYYLVGSARSVHGGWIGFQDRPAAILAFLSATAAAVCAAIALRQRPNATWWATWAVAISLLLTCPLQIAVSEFSAASFAAADLLLLAVLHLTRLRPLWTVRLAP